MRVKEAINKEMNEKLENMRKIKKEMTEVKGKIEALKEEINYEISDGAYSYDVEKVEKLQNELKEMNKRFDQLQNDLNEEREKYKQLNKRQKEMPTKNSVELQKNKLNEELSKVNAELKDVYAEGSYQITEEMQELENKKKEVSDKISKLNPILKILTDIEAEEQKISIEKLAIEKLNIEKTEIEEEKDRYVYGIPEEVIKMLEDNKNKVKESENKIAEYEKNIEKLEEQLEKHTKTVKIEQKEESDDQEKTEEEPEQDNIEQDNPEQEKPEQDNPKGPKAKVKYGKYRKVERPQMDPDAKNVKIVYDASTDKYIIENADTWKAEYFKRKDIKPINKEILAEKMGKSVEDLDYLDTNILRILMQYNKQLAKNYLKEVTEFGKTKEDRSRDMKEKGIAITYDLKGLYDKNPGEELDGKSVNVFTLEERQEILYNANMAKDMGSATVKKGLKVLFFEKLDQARMRFSKQKLLSDGKENIQISDKKKSKEEKKKEKLKKKIRRKAMKIERKHDKMFKKLEKIENSKDDIQPDVKRKLEEMKVDEETQEKLGNVVEQYKEAEEKETLEGPTSPEGPETSNTRRMDDSNIVDKEDDEMLGL